MAVRVILMMASRRFKIFGSGTSLTSSFCLPYQQFAFIYSLISKFEDWSKGCLYRAYLRLPSRTLAFRGGNFTRFDHCLEASQVHLRLNTWFFTKQLCYCRAK